MKRALFLLVVVGAIVFGADLLLRRAAENAAANLIDEKISARVDPHVRLGDFPFLLSLLTGRFDEVTVSMPRAEQGGLVVENVELTFEDVRLEALEVLGGRGDLRARSLRGRGVISEQAIDNVVARAAPGTTVEIENGRLVVVNGGLEVAATAVIANNNLLITADEALGPLEIPLPGLLPDITFSSLHARRDELVLGIRAADVRIRA